MEERSCEGCLSARRDGDVAAPGTPACLGCRRALAFAPDLPDRWQARPPGGSFAACDEQGVFFQAALSPMLGAGAVLLSVLALLMGAGIIALLLPASLLLPALGGVRHYWSVQGERLWHVTRVGALAFTRHYPAAAVRAFHCGGARVDGPVGFHLGRYTVRVAMLPAAADNEWLMRRLNERLDRSRQGSRCRGSAAAPLPHTAIAAKTRANPPGSAASRHPSAGA